MNAFLDQSGIKLPSTGARIPTPAQRESLAKKAAVTFDVNPIVARIRLDSLFSLKRKIPILTLDFAKKAYKANEAYKS
jgi:hypothetical protein